MKNGIESMQNTLLTLLNLKQFRNGYYVFVAILNLKFRMFGLRVY